MLVKYLYHNWKLKNLIGFLFGRLRKRPIGERVDPAGLVPWLSGKTANLARQAHRINKTDTQSELCRLRARLSRSVLIFRKLSSEQQCRAFPNSNWKKETQIEL